nr:response regulator [Rhizobium deserti]
MARKIRQVLNSGRQTKQAEQVRDLFVKTAPEHNPTTVGAKRVLLVEDNVLIRMSTADMLLDLGCKVLEAGSAEEALLHLEEEAIDIVVSDLGLPGMAGEDFCREVRHRWPHIDIVFATGAGHGPTLNDASPTALLSKPHGVEELRAAPEAVVGP